MSPVIIYLIFEIAILQLMVLPFTVRLLQTVFFLRWRMTYMNSMIKWLYSFYLQKGRHDNQDIFNKIC